MKRLVNGDEVDLNENAVEVVSFGNRLLVRTPDGSYSAVVVRQGESLLVSYKGRQYKVEERRSRAAVATHVGSGELRAPMPGQVVDVRRAEGDVIKKGDTILVLEAMKTQQPFTAPFDGRVVKVLVSKGDQVSEGDLLALIEA